MYGVKQESQTKQETETVRATRKKQRQKYQSMNSVEANLFLKTAARGKALGIIS
jgi:hypothetical protein